MLVGLVLDASAAPVRNGFDLGGALVPVAEILPGGPPRDGIPAIIKPRFIQAGAARFLAPRDRVLGLKYNGIAKAYPIRILNWHEIVNDRIAGKAVIVSYCPLCGTGMAFSAEAAGKVRTFGVSGLLYNSDVLLYDHESESLWSQIKAVAVAGPLRGTVLQMLVLEHTTWEDWRTRHPDTSVLSTDTGFARDYRRNPYAGYAASRRLFAPVSHHDSRYHPKELVLGLLLSKRAKAYPFSELVKTDGHLVDYLGDRKLEIRYNHHNQSARVFDSETGFEVPSMVAFWFAWTAFYPQTEVYQF